MKRLKGEDECALVAGHIVNIALLVGVLFTHWWLIPLPLISMALWQWLYNDLKKNSDESDFI